MDENSFSGSLIDSSNCSPSAASFIKPTTSASRRRSRGSLSCGLVGSIGGMTVFGWASDGFCLSGGDGFWGVCGARSVDFGVKVVGGGR